MTGSHISMSQFATRLDFETAQAEHSGKKIALYQTEGAFVPVGGSATVIIDDHHKVGHNGIRPGYYVYTSTVQWYNEDTGVFETKNTRYVPTALVQGA